MVKHDPITITNPELLEEWDYDKNEIDPSLITYGSHKKVWFICSNNHSYQARAYDKIIHNSGCPKCVKEAKSSFAEQSIFYYVKQIFPDAINGEKDAIDMDLDIYIPSINVAIEYDSYFCHNEEDRKEREIRKNQLCKEKHISLIRLRENKLNEYPDCICIFRGPNKLNKSLTELIKELFNYLNISIDVDVDRDSIAIYNQYIKKPQKNNLAETHPNIAKEWHPFKNGNLTPEMMTKGMTKKMWWLGECSHE